MKSHFYSSRKDNSHLAEPETLPLEVEERLQLRWRGALLGIELDKTLTNRERFLIFKGMGYLLAVMSGMLPSNIFKMEAGVLGIGSKIIAELIERYSLTK